MFIARRPLAHDDERCPRPRPLKTISADGFPMATAFAPDVYLKRWQQVNQLTEMKR